MSAGQDQQPKLAGVVGWPVAHSLSPMIHRIWAEREGANAYYIPAPAPASFEDFTRVVNGLRAAGFRGVNVTIPHKEHALRFADDVSEEARAAGAANMLTFRAAGVYADNSDISGFAAALRTALGVNGSRTAALVLGAGGAARGVLVALRQRCAFAEISVSNRTHVRAIETAKVASAGVIAWEDRNARLADYDVIVNTTSLGMAGSPPLDLDVSRLRPDAIVCDIVYKPLETPLLAAARARGLACVDGLSMLMHQAVPGYKSWLGAAALVDNDLRQHLERALIGGGGK